MINPMDVTYGSTHRLRKMFYGLQSMGWSIKYIESNYNGKEDVLSIRQGNNILGFLYGNMLRIYYTLVEKYDILFTQTITPLTVPSILIAKLFGKKVVVDWDDLSWVLQKSKLRALLVKLCEHYFIKCADIVFVPNNYLLDYGKTHGAKSIHYAPHGIDFDKFDPAKYNAVEVKKKLGIEGKITLGFLASFTTGGVGDLDIVLDSVSKAMKVNQELYFIVIGGGPLYSEWRKKADEYGIKNIFFTGLLKQSDVPMYLSCIDIALIYMRDNIKNKMKTSLKAGEYLAMNKTVVAHLVGQTKDDYYDLCVMSGADSKSYVSSINETAKKSNFINNSREKVQAEFSWKKTVSGINDTIAANYR